MNWVAESGKNWVEMAKNGFGKSQSWAEEKIREKGISDEHRDLVVKGGGALLLSPAIAYYGGFRSAFWFIQKYAASDYYCCEMANNGFEKSKSWAEEKIREKGISDEHRDLVVKGGGALLLSPAIAYYGGFRSAFWFIQKYAASDYYCCEMANNGFEKSKSWAEEKIREKGISDEHRDLVVKGGGALLLSPAIAYYGGFRSAFWFIQKYAASDYYCCEMANNGFEKSKSWAEEKIREKGISDEHRDLVVKGGGALLLSPAIAYYGGFRSAFWFIQKYAASDYYCCEMANNGFEKSKSWAEEKIREKGISDEHRDLVVKGGGALLLSQEIKFSLERRDP